MHYKNTIRFILVALIAGLALAAFDGMRRLSAGASELPQSAAPSASPAPEIRTAAPILGEPMRERYPYRSAHFTRFVAQSYQQLGGGDAESFYAWMDKAYEDSHVRLPGKESLGLEGMLQAEQRELSGITDPAEKAKAEVELGAYLHKLVKTIIPRFSLDRGFEFVNVVRRGERQCFLQSVLIAGLLQRMGVDAGVAMVFRNIRGESTNNGHAVALVKLADGEDIIVDASDPEPFAEQKGLFAVYSGYRYVDPVYVKETHRIHAYRTAAGGERILPRHLRTLDLGFLESQFWYYRGERAEGGIVSAAKTREGLAASAAALEKSLHYCPKNPLSAYMLGRVYMLEGSGAKARTFFKRAYVLYSQFGWVPPNSRQYFRMAGLHDTHARP